MGVANKLTSAPYRAAPAPRLAYMYKNEWGHLSFHNKQISLLDAYATTNRKSAIFTLVANLAIFHISYFEVLVPGLSSDQLQLLGMSSQQDGHENYLKDRYSVTPCDRGVASKFDYTPWKHEVLYLGHTRSNRLQTTHVRQESRPCDSYKEIMS